MKRVSACQPGNEARSGRSTASSVHLPAANLKCAGIPAFRTTEARDYSYLLDLDPGVVTWEAYSEPLSHPNLKNNSHAADFLVKRVDCLLLVEVWPGEPKPPRWISVAALDFGCYYLAVPYAEISSGHELRNAKDLLRYARYRVALGDRIRLLAALEEAGTLTLAECMAVVRESRPMASIASMIIDGFLQVDLASAPLSPETLVRRTGAGRS